MQSPHMNIEKLLEKMYVEKDNVTNCELFIGSICALYFYTSNGDPYASFFVSIGVF